MEPLWKSFRRFKTAGVCAALGLGVPFAPTSHSECGDLSAVRRSAAGGTGHVTVGPNVQVSRDRSTAEHYEVILAADANRPGHLVAGSIVRATPTRDTSVVYASTDAGKTWRLAYSPTGSPGKETTIFDPAVAYGPRGEAYFAALFVAAIPGPHVPDYYMEIVRSEDGGTIWGKPTRIDGYNDRPYLAVDGTNGNHQSWLYCNSGLHGGGHGIRASDDGGKTFSLSPQSRLRTAPPDQALNTGQSVVLSNGVLVVPFIYLVKDKSKSVSPQETAREAGLSVRCSTDGGATLEPVQPQIALCRHTDRDGIPMLAAQPGTTQFKDHLYLAWSDSQVTGSRVMLAYSQDRGASWSRPMPLSEQPRLGTAGAARQPSAQNTNGYDAFLPSVAVNKEGVVGVWWYGARAVPGGRSGWDVYFRASLDGGRTWSPSVKVTNETSIVAPASDARLGDTAGIAVDANGEFHLLWIDNRTGVRQVWTAAVTVKR